MNMFTAMQKIKTSWDCSTYNNNFFALCLKSIEWQEVYTNLDGNTTYVFSDELELEVLNDNPFECDKNMKPTWFDGKNIWSI